MNTNKSGIDVSPNLGMATRQDQAKLEALAYRFLGTVSDAEDAVQETYLRWYKLHTDKRAEIEAPLAWKRTTLTRVCLDKLKSAKSKRLKYVGQWLPEPVSQSYDWLQISGLQESSISEERLEMTGSVSMALMIILEKMTPAERVCFILHDVFDYKFDEISEMVGRKPQSCRQLAFSARKRVEKTKRTQPTKEEHAKVNAEFIKAWITGDVKSLIATLNSDARVITDGGGLVSAALDPIIGPEVIAKFFLGIFKYEPDLRVEYALVNGDPGFVGIAHSKIISVISTLVVDGSIIEVWVMRNPEKMSDWQQLH